MIVDIRKKCISIKTALELYPALRKYEKNGRLDFGDSDALKTYNLAIAKILLGLEIKLPDDYLIPTICLRYYYIKTLMDIVNFSNMLEIGTGSSAIMAMIAAKVYDVEVDATEINQKSLDFAHNNIKNNQLDDKITLLKSDGGILKGVINDKKYDVLVCYPPMYPDSDLSDFTTDRNIRGFQGAVSEMIGGGDGFEFISKLIIESMELDGQIRVVTVLNIKKTHSDRVTELFDSRSIQNQVIVIIAGNRSRYINIGYIRKIM